MNRLLGTYRNMDVSTLQNWLNRLPDGWNSPQSPDELVIQKRGRRRSIVWSPDLDTYKRRSLLRYDLYLLIYTFYKKDRKLGKEERKCLTIFFCPLA